MSERTDEELIAGVVSGREADFNELYRRHHYGLKSYIARNFREHRTQVDDIMQRAWLRIWKHAASYDNSTKVFTWMRNVCCMEIRRQIEKATNQDAAESTYVDNVLAVNPVLAAPDESPLDSLVRQEDTELGMASVQAAAMMVGPRAVRIMADIMEGVGYAEIAEKNSIHKCRVGQIVEQIRAKAEKLEKIPVAA